MSMYNIQNYINNIPMVLGQKKEEEIPVVDGRELVEQARILGLKVPKYY
jgi:hypothetical protein